MYLDSLYLEQSWNFTEDALSENYLIRRKKIIYTKKNILRYIDCYFDNFCKSHEYLSSNNSFYTLNEKYSIDNFFILYKIFDDDWIFIIL